MSEESPHIDLEGIHIDRDLADEVAIEEELDSNVVGPYRFPSPNRRRVSGWVYLVFEVAASFTIPAGWMVGVGFGLLAAWQFLSAWPLNIDEREAMTRAAAAVEFTIGHSSAVVRFSGWRSRPRWSVVTYSATEPPDRRALVVVDAVSGEIAEVPYTEDIVAV